MWLWTKGFSTTPSLPGFAPTEGILLRRVSEAETASPSQEKDLTHHILHRATTRDLQLVLKGIHVSDTQPPEAFSKLCCLGFLEKAVSQFHTAIMFFFKKKNYQHLNLLTQDLLYFSRAKTGNIKY